MAERGDESLVHTLKKVAAVLKQSEIPFALGGSFAVYAHGGHSSDHDVDFLHPRGRTSSGPWRPWSAAGFTAERPPEDWLVKVYDDGRMVDLIHRPIETPVTEETFADTVVRPVDAIHMPVLSATQLMVHKLLSFSQHYCDFARGLPLARSLREQIDWERVRKETQHSPYAEAFLVLLDRLEVVPAAGTQRRRGRPRDRDRDTAPGHPTSTSRRRSNGCWPRTPPSPNRASPWSAGSAPWCSTARWRARTGGRRSCAGCPSASRTCRSPATSG